MLSRGLMDWNLGRAAQRFDGLKFGHASQRSDGLILDMLPRGSMALEFGHASQSFDGIGIWTCIPEFQWNF